MGFWKILAVDLQEQLSEGTENIPKGEFQLATALNAVYGVMGLVAVVVIIYNAATYLSSQGDPGKAKKATQGLIFAGIGLAVVVLAVVITNFLATTVGGAK